MTNVTNKIARALAGTVLAAVLGSGLALTAGASLANAAGAAEYGIVEVDEEDVGIDLQVRSDATVDPAGDGTVDQADLLIWQQNFGGSGDVAGDDLLVWQETHDSSAHATGRAVDIKQNTDQKT